MSTQCAGKARLPSIIILARICACRSPSFDPYPSNLLSSPTCSLVDRYACCIGVFSLGHISLPFSISPHYKTIEQNPELSKSKSKMAGLQRSSLTFRRSGSSGMVWDHESLMSEDHHGQMDQGEPEFKELRHSRSVGSLGLQRRRRRDGDGGGSSQAYRTRRVTPALDPPSPKVPGPCIFCGIFRKAGSSEPSKPRRY